MWQPSPQASTTTSPSELTEQSGHRGRSEYGALGVPYGPTPRPIQGLYNVVAIAANWENSLALKSDGTVWAWGQNYYGQLGNGTSDTYVNSVPSQVLGLSDVAMIATGYEHSVALKADGTVWAWGQNYYGQLGKGTTTGSASQSSSAASAGALRCCGDSSQLRPYAGRPVRRNPLGMGR